MELITPFDLVALFPESQSLAVVGNAPSVMDRELGSYIDSHDIVVRFNECALDDYAQFVGTRTDILVSNPYPEKRQRPLLDGGAAQVLLIINPQTRRGDRQAFERWAGEHKVLFTYTPDLVRVERSEHMAGLTTGTYAIQLLWRVLRPSRMLCTGFTMFHGSESEAQHYWTSLAPPGVAAHDLQTEAAIFLNVLNSVRTPVEVTPDVMDISRRHGIALGSHVRLSDSGG
jgi:hypothetical protein